MFRPLPRSVASIAGVWVADGTALAQWHRDPVDAGLLLAAAADLVEEKLHGRTAELVVGERDRCQLGPDPGGEHVVVEGDHGDVGGDPKPRGRERPGSTQGATGAAADERPPPRGSCGPLAGRP